MIKVGQKAPNFQLTGDDDQTHSLSAHVGRWVIVYFYPKDNTPGCTTEACDFRDEMRDLADKNVVVYGISKDSIKSHLNFKEKYALNFTLLSDESLITHKAYGALDDQKVIRSTFLIDPKGKVAHLWPKVQVNGHVEEVIQTLQNLDTTTS